MIHVVEIPEYDPPVSWSAINEDDFADQVLQKAEARGHFRESILETTSTRRLLQERGYGPDTKPRNISERWLAELAIARDLDTPVFITFRDTHYTTQAPDRFQVTRDWLARDLNELMIFHSEEEAEAALENTRLWKCHQGAAARSALLDQLNAHFAAAEDPASEEERQAMIAELEKNSGTQ